ncbi:MAG: hypothetical protein P8X94_08460 [Woeseiaceae bacterium]
MIKTFLFGIVLGAIVAAGALYAFPVVDQARETSIIAVAPNGGTIESFHTKIPIDRVMTGAPARGELVPPGLEWPVGDLLAGVRMEMFKIRNARDAVVGVGVRTAARRGDEVVIDWMLHLPARGSLIVSMEPQPRESGTRIGTIVSGSREFAELEGALAERWVANQSGDDDAPLGRIELRASYLSQLEPALMEDATQ